MCVCGGGGEGFPHNCNYSKTNFLVWKVGIGEILLNHEQTSADIEEDGIYWPMSVLLATCVIKTISILAS